MKKIALTFCFGILISTSLLAQTEPDAIALQDDEFQNAFYESLLQKGIENYDKAIVALEKCKTLQPNNDVVFFEMGKNYLSQKNYKDAYDSFEKATQINPGNQWYWVGMYDVCYETKDYTQAISIVTKLIEFQIRYKEDLVSLYMNTQQFDKALALINELNDTIGKSDQRENYKMQILRESKYQNAEKENLLAQIRKFPKEESNYVALIFLYSENNEEDKALEITKQLEKEIPTSDWAQVSLFKHHLNNDDGANVVLSMNKVLASSKIDSKIKHRMLNEFLIFIKEKPQFDKDLEKAISYFDSDREVKVAKEIAKFYHNKSDWEKAIKYYEMHLKNNSEDFEVQLLLLEVYTEKQDFTTIVKKAENLQELYPSQPQFYYYAGLAYNQLLQYKKAKDALETGIDFVLDDKALEINFNIQIGEAWAGLGDQKKKEAYFLKADALMKQKR